MDRRTDPKKLIPIPMRSAEFVMVECGPQNARTRRVGMTAAALAFLVYLFNGAARAECELSELIGYTMIAEKTVAGFVENGKKSDEFEGCDFDRIIIFDDNTGVRCDTYNYSYSYRPSAYIFANRFGAIKMCVEDELFDVTQIR